ncbi:EAL domain-containing protein [Vibrio alginolyticus]|nr:EAL domain-containing protein [Vibrio alginolyticus]
MDTLSHQISIENNDTYASFEFLLQPIYKPSSFEIVFYEVLSRVTSESGEIFNNESFFTSISNDFIKKISVRQINYFSKMELDVPFFINLTLSCLIDDEFIETIINFKCWKIGIEITEIDCPINDNLLKNIKKLQDNDAVISLDDYKINDYLASSTFGIIPWDYIKIDKEFLFLNTDNSMEVQSVLFTLSPFCNNGIIFEGVETSYQFDFMKKYDVYLQGFFLFPPEIR